MVFITVWAVIVTVWSGMITFPGWLAMWRERKTDAERGRGRQSETQGEAELKDSLSRYLWTDKLNHASGSLQARQKLFSCSFVQPKQFALFLHTGSWAALIKSEFYSFHYSLLTDSCCWTVQKLWYNQQNLVALKLLYSYGPRSRRMSNFQIV